MASIEWIIAFPPPRPTVFATVRTDHWQMTAETTHVTPNLAVLQYSMLILTCVAGYPVSWHQENETQDSPEQTRTYHPLLEGNASFGVPPKNYSINNDFEIPAIDRYETNLTIKNFTAAMEGLYLCQHKFLEIEDLKTEVNLTVKLEPDTSTHAEVIQAGFVDKIRPQPSFFFRYWSTKLSIPFIYGIPPNGTVTYALSTSDPEKEWSLPQPQSGNNSKVLKILDFMEVEQKLVSPRLGMVTFLITKGSYFHKGDCYFILRTHTKEAVIQTKQRFFLWLDTIEYLVEEPEQLTRYDSSTLLTIYNFYEIRLYYSNPDWKNPRVLVQEQEQQTDGCIPKKVPAAQADTICGVGAVSFFHEQLQNASDKGIRIFMYVKRACVLTVVFDSENQDGTVVSPSLYIAALDFDIFGFNRAGAKLIAVPIPENDTAFTNESITLRCLMPKCHLYFLSWCSEAYQSCQWPPYNYNNEVPAGAFDDGQMINAIMSFSEYNNHTISSNAYFPALKVKNTDTYSCGLLPPSSRKQTIQQPQAAKLQLHVKDPRPPTFTDGRNFATLYQTFKRGSSLPLLCKVDGLPKPLVTWTWVTDSTSGFHSRDFTDNSTLEVDQAGTYVCNASSKYGWNSRTYIIQYDKSYLPFAIAIPLAAIVFAFVALMAWWIRRRAIEASFKDLAKSLRASTDAIPLDDSTFLNDQVQFLRYNRDLEIDRSRFTMTSKLLGIGEFGSIYKGELKTNEDGDIQEVAIKVPRDSLNLLQFRSLADELKIMSHIRPHVNVLALVGACTQDIENRQLFVLTEFCENGSLKDYLAKNFMKFEGFEVNAQGQFLIIHRDLALRNLLLTGNHIVKIADFGMSRHHVSDAVYKKKLSDDVPIPVFWMALESLAYQQSTKTSDVWSFGIVLWEMFSCGKRPYPNHSPDPAFLNWLMEKEEHRMGPPNIACDEIYQLMLTCWKSDPEARPSFSKCKRVISHILEERSPSMYQSMVVNMSDAWLTVPSNAHRKSSDSSGSRTPERNVQIHIVLEANDKSNSLSRAAEDAVESPTAMTASQRIDCIENPLYAIDREYQNQPNADSGSVRGKIVELSYGFMTPEIDYNVCQVIE